MPDSEVYSYHTYMLPFIWKYPQNRIQSSLEHIARVFDCNPNWKCCNQTKGNEVSVIASSTDEALKDAYLFYKEYQYFRPYVRDALYGYDKSLMRCYELEGIHNKGHYLITAKGKTYDLSINAVKVMLYNTGVGLFIMECENLKGVNNGEQASLEAVKNINDYGRRICMPFLPPKGNFGISVTAEKLEVKLNDTTSFACCDFKSFAESRKSSKDILSPDCMTYIAKFVKDILGFGSVYKFSSNENEAAKPNTIFIHPAMDDRMYVNSYVCDAEAVNYFLALSNPEDKDSFAYKTDSSRADSLYELAFSDPAGNCTCQSEQMRNEMLDNHIYKRWLKYGTIYTVAQQGMHMLTNTPLEHLRDSFLTQYNRMCILCLVQLSSLEFFERELKQINTGKRKGFKALADQTMLLRHRYARYQSQIGFSRISSQEQAIEMYDLLRATFGIDQIEEQINTDITALTESSSARSEYFIGIGAIVLAINEMLGMFFDFTAPFSISKPLTGIINLVVVLAVILFVSLNKDKKKG